MNDFLNEPTASDEDETQPGRRPVSASFTRGMNPRAAASWVRAHHGDAGIDRLYAALPEHVREDLGAKLRPAPTAWVPFQSHALLLNTIDDLFGAGDKELLREVGRYMASHDFPAIARPLVRLMSPGWFLDMATKIWSVYNSHGHWEVERGARELRGVLSDALEHDVGFCVGVSGWVEGALLYCGATEAHCTEEKCAAKGDAFCSVRVTWLEKMDTVRNRVPRAPL